MGSISALLADAGIPEEFMDWILGCLDFASVEDYDDIVQKKLQKIQEEIMNVLSQTLQLPSFPEFERWQKLKEDLLSTLQDKLAQLEEVIAQIEDPKKLLHFTSYELEVDDPCSLDSLLDAIGELIDQLITETQETFEAISASLGGNIIAILIMVIADFVTAELASLAEQWQLESLFGNALKSLMNSIAMVLLAVNGAKLYMQYLASVALSNQIAKREELTEHLITQYTALISILQKMKTQDSGEQNVFMEIQLSRGYVGKADGKLGIELGRVTATPPNMVSKTRISQARGDIADAIKALAQTGESDEIGSIVAMNDLLNEYDIPITMWSFTHAQLKQLSALIKERFFTVSWGTDYTRFGIQVDGGTA